MTLEKYYAMARANRGKLSKMEPQMKNVYMNGSNEFAQWMVEGDKRIGFHKASDIVDELTLSEQKDLIAWISTKRPKATSDDIELKKFSIIKNR